MAITFENVYYQYKNEDKNYSLNDITFDLEGHFFAGVIGETGSGKSTLIQHINALLRPSKGLVKIDDFTVQVQNKKKLKKIKELRKKVGVVFQFPEYQLFEDTVLKDVAFGPKNFNVSKEDAIKKAKKALKMVGIDESYYEKSPFELSGGERRKVAIAGIIAIEPEILVLDEPCAGLDPKSSSEMMELFLNLYNQGLSLIMVSHNMDIVLKYCTKCLVLNRGKLLYNLKPTEFFYNEMYLNTAKINEPNLLYYVKMALKKNYKLDVNNIKDISSFILELKRCKNA